MKKYSGDYRWVRKRVSLRNENFKLAHLKYHFEDTEDILTIDNTYWDLIYVCRSGMWSSPHLDALFFNTFSWIPESGFACKIEKDIFKSRYTEEMQEDIAQLQKIQQETINAHKP